MWREAVPDNSGILVVKVTWAHPENRVWSHMFTQWGQERGHMGNRPHPQGTQAPEVATVDEGHFHARKCTRVWLFTDTQQSFKFSSFIKRRGEGRKTKQNNN